MSSNPDINHGDNSEAFKISKQLEAYNFSLQKVFLALVNDPGHDDLTSLRNDLAAEIISTAKSLYDAIRNCEESKKAKETDDETSIKVGGEEEKQIKKQTFFTTSISETTESSSRSNQLNDYRHSLEKVSSALSKDPANEELLNLQKDLLEVISLSEKALLIDLDKLDNHKDKSTEENGNLTKTADIAKPSLSSPKSLDSLPDENSLKMCDPKELCSVSGGHMDGVEDNSVGNPVVYTDYEGKKVSMIDFNEGRIDKVNDNTLYNLFRRKNRNLNRICINDHRISQGLQPLHFRKNRGKKARERSYQYAKRMRGLCNN